MTGTGLLRILALATGGAIIGQVAIVFYVYLLAWKRSPHVRGLVPRYVVGVALYAILAEAVFMLLVVDLHQRHARISMFGPLILTANLVLMVALAYVFRYDRRRISAANPPFEPDQVPLRRAEDIAPPTSRWWGRITRRRTHLEQEQSWKS